MIEYAVRKHFPDLPDSTGPRDYARNYLEKLIQVPFRIPALGEAETRIYVALLLAGAEVGENDADYGKLIAVAREKLKRPWTSGGLDAATIKTALGKQAEKANNALALSDQIGPILASGTKGNPRQIKRFLNTLLLRERTATARGFGDDIKLPDLHAQPLDTRQATGVQVRSFQYAIERLKGKPQLANLLIHKPGSLADEAAHLDQLADVYRRGLGEVAQLIDGAEAKPS